MDFFSRAKVFDPYQLATMGHDLDAYKFPKWINESLSEDWPIYTNIVKSLIPNTKPDDFKLEKWWTVFGKRMPGVFAVANWYLRVPATTCDCERSFSKYREILSDKRRSMKPETIQRLNFMFFNFSKSDELEIERIVDLDENNNEVDSDNEVLRLDSLSD